MSLIPRQPALGGGRGRAGTPERARNGAVEWILSVGRPEGGAAVSEASCVSLSLVLPCSEFSVAFIILHYLNEN